MQATSPLTAPRVLCERHAKLHRAASTDVVHLISLCLDVSPRWSVPRAAKTGALRWFSRVLDARRRNIDPDLLDHELTQALRLAARLGHNEVVEYIVSLPDVHVPIRGALEEAAARGDAALVASLSHRRVNDACLASAAVEAAKNGHLQVLQDIAATLGGVAFLSQNLDIYALQPGHLSVVEWLASQSWIFPSSLEIVADVVASNGTLETMRWFHEHAPKEATTDPNLVNSAARQQNWAVLEYLVDTVQLPLSSVAFACVVESGPLELTTKFFKRNSTPSAPITIEPKLLLDVAAAGKTDVLEFLFVSFPDVLKGTPLLDWAAKSREISVIEWIESHVSAELLLPMTGLALVHAAEVNALTLLQWLKARGVNDWSPQVLQRAVFNQADLDLIQWLLTEHYDEVWTPSVMLTLAERGRHDVLKWIHSEIKDDDSWSDRLMDVAASSGRLETLQWLEAHRSLRCTTGGLNQAAMFEQWSTVDWLLDSHQVDGDNETLRFVASAGRVEIVERLLSKADDLNGAIRDCLSSAKDSDDDNQNHFAVVRLLCDNGAKVSDASCLAHCAKNGQLEILQWLFTQKLFTSITLDILVQATRHGQAAVVRWMLRHVTPMQRLTVSQVVSLAASMGEQDVLEALVDFLGPSCVTPQLLYSTSQFGPRHLGSTVAAWLFDHIADKGNVVWRSVLASTCPAVQHWASQHV
ncbi:hypothetical protein PINS_up006045 [Pythium insidiosum]|nr:hypothetical protein PINS_up006045 [Pythium insidiosum]